MSRLSVPLLIGAIGTLAVMGAFLQSHGLFGAIIMMVLGLLTVFGTTIGLKPAAVLIGFVLGPGIEKELIRGYQIGGFERFLKPASLVILVIIAVTLAIGLWQTYKERKKATAFALSAAASGSSEPSTPEPPHEEIRLGDVLADRVIATLAILLALSMFWQTTHYPLFASLWIYFVAAFFILLPACLLWLKNISLLPTAIDWLRSNRGDLTLDRSGLASQGVVLAAFIIFIGLISTLGFIVSSAVFVLLLMLYFDRNVIRSVLSAVSVAFLAWAVITGFQIYLPRGIFNI